MFGHQHSSETGLQQQWSVLPTSVYYAVKWTLNIGW